MDRDHLFRTCREHVGHNGIPRCVITVSTRTVHCTHTYSACSGTAIYVYLILSNAPLSTSFVSNVICDFRLDGTIVGHFRHDTDGTNIFQYNVLAFSQEQLAPASHTISIETTGMDSSYVIFDRAVYT